MTLRHCNQGKELILTIGLVLFIFFFNDTHSSEHGFATASSSYLSK